MFINKQDAEYCSGVIEFCKKLEDAVAQHGINNCTPWVWNLFIGFKYPNGNIALHAAEINAYFGQESAEARESMLTLVANTIRAGSIRFEAPAN